MGSWWPAGRTVAKKPHVEIVIEPREGGRWYEIDADGAETDWGKVLAWEPPGRLLLAWQLGPSWTYDPAFVTELELTFAPAGSGSSVTLEHRDLERFGTEAANRRAQLDGGWPGMLEGYAIFTRSA